MTPGLEHVADFVVELAPPHELGSGPHGVQRIIPIIGGTVSGPRLNGRILGVGADWQVIAAGAIAQLDARYALETADGAVIEIHSQGIRHAPEDVAARMARGEAVPMTDYYMRTAIRLTSGHPAYDWVNRALFVASGGKQGSTVRLHVYRVT